MIWQKKKLVLNLHLIILKIHVISAQNTVAVLHIVINIVSIYHYL